MVPERAFRFQAALLMALAAAACDSTGSIEGSDGGRGDGPAPADRPRLDGPGPTDGGTGSDGSAAGPVYPLKKSANGRYLVDQNGTPYLIAGDAPQSLTVNLSESEAEMYFADRQAHGFNTLWVNLICNDYTGGRADGTTFDGLHPFLNGNDFSMPNEQFFARADRMIRMAAQHGLQIMLDPAETGGWLGAMRQNGVQACRNYGRYLGNRYRDFDNLIWFNGNDYQNWSDPANDAVVTAVALGIKDNDTRHIHTIELNYLSSGSLDDPNWAPIISLNASYTYYPTYAQVLTDYNRANFEPVFMVEAVYEYESNAQAHESTPSTLRREEYWTNLSGATGQLYGNHYTWTFTAGWQSHLDSPGALQMPHVKAFFEPRAWYNLVPDQNHSVLTSGYGTFSATGYVDDSDYVTAARTPDGTLVLAYLPTVRTVTVDMTKLAGSATARWYDPSNGTYTTIAGSPFANTGSQSFAPPGPNGDGDGDWVLAIETSPP